jgi:hypothetical protein
MSIKDTWKKTWSVPAKRKQLITIAALIPVFFTALPFFFSYAEKRRGVMLNDLLLAQIPPHDVSVLIFALIWGMILLILYRSVFNPSIFITYCLTLASVTAARMMCIALVPLSPPAGLIPLSDPLTGIFYGETSITKDLFFSGHTALLTLIYFCLEKKNDKRLALFAVISVAILLLVQHIHYTIDVLAAPVIVFVLHRFTVYLLDRKKRRRGISALIGIKRRVYKLNQAGNNGKTNKKKRRPAEKGYSAIE